MEVKKIMAISKETAQRIEEMTGQGLSIRNIADVLNLNREMVRRYMKGDFKPTDTENTDFDTNTDTNNDLNDNKEFLNDQLQTFKEQIRQELDNLKSEITQFIREEAPLKVDLDNVKQENKSLKGKLEFIKKVLKEFNPDIYKKVVNEVFKR